MAYECRFDSPAKPDMLMLVLMRIPAISALDCLFNCSCEANQVDQVLRLNRRRQLDTEPPLLPKLIEQVQALSNPFSISGSGPRHTTSRQCLKTFKSDNGFT